MKKLENNIIKEIINDNRIKIIIITTLACGFVAHGSIMFNNYAFFDNSDLFNIGSTYALGRWFLGILSWLTMYVCGSLLYTTPLFNGILTIVIIGITTYFIVNLLEIKNNILIIILNALMVVFPAVTSALGYMFTAPYYFFGLLIGVLGVYIFYKKRNVLTFIISIVLLSCSTGTYQANLAFCVGLLLVLTIKQIFAGSGNIKIFFNEILINGSICVLSLLVYFFANSICLTLTKTRMSTYKNAGSWQNTTIKDYMERVRISYKEFFSPVNATSRNMYPFSIMKFYKIILVVVGIVLVIILIKTFKQSIKKGIQLVFLFLLIPLANNFVYLMCDINDVYSIMMYGNLVVFIFAIYLLSIMENKYLNYLKYIMCIVLLAISFLYIKFDNDCYLKADILQNQMRSYLTTLVTQIKSVDGYTDGMKICFVGEDNKNDLSIPMSEELNSIYIHPYHLDTLIHDYNFKRIMERQVGFYPERVDDSAYENDGEVIGMPSYPNEGSIKIINDVVVVKFSN